MAAKTAWDKHPLPMLSSPSESELPKAVRELRKSTAQATAAATKGQWLMELIKSLKRPKNSLTAISLTANNISATKRIDILAEFESTVITRATVVSRAMKCKAPIHAEAWDEVIKDDAKVEIAFDQLLVYINEFNFQMTRATANAAPAHHAIAETKYDDDIGNQFGGVAVYFLLTSTADKHVQKKLDSMLEQLGEYVTGDVKRAMDVGTHLERIHIQYHDLIKAKENLTVLHSRILPKVLVKLSDGRHVGSDCLDCAEWQQIGIKAAEWQVLREEDASEVSWNDVYLDLVITYEHIVTHRTRTYGGDPTGPAGRNVRFPVGVGLGAMDMDASGDGDDELAYGLAAYQSAFGKPATVKDYTELVEHGKPLPGSVRTTFNGTRKDETAGKKTGPQNNSRRENKSEPERKTAYPRPSMPKWHCEKCNFENWYFDQPGQNPAVRKACTKCRQPKKTSHVGNIGKPHVVTEPHLGAAAIERLIEERVISGVQKALDAQKTSDGSVMAGFAQADYSGNAFSLGLGGIVADSISSLEDDESRIPDDGEAIIDQFGNNADAYLKRTTNYSEALVHQIATMSCIVMFISSIYGFASSVPNRLWQACSSATTWLAPAAGGRHATTAGVCILLACCVLFTQLASTQALSPHTITAIGARHAIENWGIESSPDNATRYGLKRIAQGHQQYCLQAANGFAKGQLFLDSGASTTLIHDVSMLVNVRRLSEPKMVMGLTGPQAIKFTGDLCLEMLNTTGKSSKIVVKDVYYDPSLQYNLVSVTDISRTGHVTTFSTDSNRVTGPAGAFELIKTCGVYALPVVSGTALAAFGVSNMTEEELMHLRMNHCVSYAKMQVLSKSGARGINPQLKCTKRQCNICVHANITRHPAPPASTGQTATVRDMSFDLFDMSKITTIGGNRYCSVFIDNGRYATAVVHATKDEIPEIFDRVLSQTPDCHKPTIVKSDCASEYHTHQLREVLKKHNVQEQLHSNEHQQFQNGRAEKLVDSIGRKIRGMLLQSQMPPEFWGAAVVLATDIYNCTPHRSLGMESPHYHRYHKQPDLSFFRAFGCATVVHRGRDLVEHTKLAPRGELGVYLGVGTSHGRRAFIIYSPRTSRVYATIDARFDETYFPFRTTNQRVYGQDYTPSIQLEQLSLYHDMPNPTVASIVERLQSTAVPCSTAWDIHDLLQLPAAIEEQRPLDLEAMRSGDAEYSISGEPPSVTTGPVARTDDALEGFVPSYKAQDTVFVNGPPAPYGTLAPSWRDAGSKTVKQVDNTTLAEYLIGSEAKIVLPESYWPKDKVSWTTQCMDHRENKRAKGNHTFKCVLLESKPRYVGGTGVASTYEAELSAWHVRNALEQQHGSHKTLDEMFGGENRGLLGLATDRLCSAVRSTAARMPGGKIRRKESSNTMGAAMIGMIWTAMACDEHGQQFAGMRPVPRSYYDIKGRPDEHLWAEACDKEIKKLFEMGTFSIVDENDIPPGHKSINCCMSFKIKKDGDGNILEYRARCNADGRQQEVGSYGDTSAPTSKFRLMIMIFIYSSIHDL